jgi:hypothetical protein
MGGGGGEQSAWTVLDCLSTFLPGNLCTDSPLGHTEKSAIAKVIDLIAKLTSLSFFRYCPLICRDYRLCNPHKNNKKYKYCGGRKILQ